MSERRSSVTQMAEINATILAGNEKLKNANRTANEAINTQDATGRKLDRQKGVIEGNIDKTKDIQYVADQANRKINQMRRRNFCIKLILWLVVIVLFAANIGLIIWKAS